MPPAKPSRQSLLIDVTDVSMDDVWARALVLSLARAGHHVHVVVPVHRAAAEREAWACKGTTVHMIAPEDHTLWCKVCRTCMPDIAVSANGERLRIVSWVRDRVWCAPPEATEWNDDGIARVQSFTSWGRQWAARQGLRVLVQVPAPVR